LAFFVSDLVEQLDRSAILREHEDLQHLPPPSLPNTIGSRNGLHGTF
jgi:hypothetical protein